MPVFDQPSTSSVHPNVFTTQFLARLNERDEPPTAGDADVAGPWRIEPIPGEGFGLFRIGESLARGVCASHTGRGYKVKVLTTKE